MREQEDVHVILFVEPICYSLLGTGDFILCTTSTMIYVSSTIGTGPNTCYLLLVFGQVWRFDCYGELLDET